MPTVFSLVWLCPGMAKGAVSQKPFLFSKILAKPPVGGTVTPIWRAKRAGKFL